MKIFSEKTRKLYPTTEACLADEKLFDEKMAKEKAEREEKLRVRKERAQEVEAALKAAQEAQDKYISLRNEFVKDYGAYHMTIRSQSIPAAFEELFTLLL